MCSKNPKSLNALTNMCKHFKPQRAPQAPATLIKADRWEKALSITCCILGGSQCYPSKRRRESTVTFLLCEQKAPGRRDQILRVGETSSSPCGRVQKIEAILSRTLDQGLNQLLTVPSALEARGLE